jgi:DNA-binding CsgD family transcriptional regulator
MAETVSTADLRRLMVLIDESRRQYPPEGLPPITLELLHELVRCDFVSFCDLEPTQQRTALLQESSAEIAEVSVADEDLFWLHFWDCQPCSYSVVSGDERTVTTISDFYSLRLWHHTGMYNDCLRHFGVDHEAIVCLSSPRGHSRRLVLFRCGGIDFDHRDRLMLALLRPHLDELYQELQRLRRTDLRLTPRQHQLLGLVAAGYSNSDIARELVISAATVRTHLEKIFQTLGVTSRTAAVAKAFPSAPY